MSFFYRKKEAKKQGFIKTLVNIASIISAVITCLRLTIYGLITVETSVLIMLAVVVFVAIGNNISKIILSIIALAIFVLLYSGATNVAFTSLLKSVLTLIIIFIGVYIIIRSLFGRK